MLEAFSFNFNSQCRFRIRRFIKMSVWVQEIQYNFLLYVYCLIIGCITTSYKTMSAGPNFFGEAVFKLLNLNIDLKPMK